MAAKVLLSNAKLMRHGRSKRRVNVFDTDYKDKHMLQRRSIRYDLCGYLWVVLAVMILTIASVISPNLGCKIGRISVSADGKIYSHAEAYRLRNGDILFFPDTKSPPRVMYLINFERQWVTLPNAGGVIFLPNSIYCLHGIPIGIPLNGRWEKVDEFNANLVIEETSLSFTMPAFAGLDRNTRIRMSNYR